MMSMVSYGASSSASYSIPVEEVNSSISSMASPSYGIFGEARGYDMHLVSSAGFGLGEGFLFTAFPSLAVIVTTVAPDSGYNSGAVNITEIAGAGFMPNASVKLVKGNEQIAASNVNVENGMKISCMLDLTGHSTGLWNLAVINPNGTSGSLPSAFTIKSWASAGAAVNYPNPFNPLSGPTAIIYQLDSDRDVSLLLFNISYELILKKDLTATLNGGKAGDNSVTWDGRNHFGDLVGNGVYFIRIVDRHTGNVLVKGKIAVSR